MKKGFTLVELLGAIVILAVLMLVVTPAVLSIARKNKENMYCGKIKTAIKAAQLYGEENFKYIDDTIEGDESKLMEDNTICNIGGKIINHCQITTISNLADKGYLKLEKVGKSSVETEFLDPRNFTSMLNDQIAIYIVNKRINAQFIYNNSKDGKKCADSVQVGGGRYKSFYYHSEDSIDVGQ